LSLPKCAAQSWSCEDDGKITRFTAIYDSFQFPDTVYQSLVLLAAKK